MVCQGSPDNRMVAPASPGLSFKLLRVGDALQRVTELPQPLMAMHAAGSALLMQIILAAALTSGHDGSVLEMKWTERKERRLFMRTSSCRQERLIGIRGLCCPATFGIAWLLRGGI